MAPRRAPLSGHHILGNLMKARQNQRLEGNRFWGRSPACRGRSDFRAAVAGPCSQPSHLLTCKIAGAAGVSILRIAVPRSEKPETDRKTPGWLLNS